MWIKKTYTLIVVAVFFQLQCKSQKTDVAYKSESLKVISISENSYVHISYLNTNDFGTVACNGMIYLKNKEAVIFDTPSDLAASEELLKWLTDAKKVKVKAIVVNHFHVDCLAGLNTFHQAEIASYANTRTIALAMKDSVTAPQIGFEMQNELNIGGERIINRHFGEAHTEDNIISYIPSEELIFGGCMIKSLNAPKGNLEDANTDTWSKTVQNIKDNYPNLKVVVPGHGKYGSTELLDYTIELFKPN
ncbi:MAG: subclass B1 metallo-beta-lactamase [Maribacter sp.]|uniref:subclass B1 metallo-beta-lactamase n=1 Tax=Maribacter sp. TaxID=1897614 RepID=UPI00329A3C9A